MFSTSINFFVQVNFDVENYKCIEVGTSHPPDFNVIHIQITSLYYITYRVHCIQFQFDYSINFVSMEIILLNYTIQVT